MTCCRLCPVACRQTKQKVIQVSESFTSHIHNWLVSHHLWTSREHELSLFTEHWVNSVKRRLHCTSATTSNDKMLPQANTRWCLSLEQTYYSESVTVFDKIMLGQCPETGVLDNLQNVWQCARCTKFGAGLTIECFRFGTPWQNKTALTFSKWHSPCPVWEPNPTRKYWKLPHFFRLQCRSKVNSRIQIINKETVSI